MIANNGRIALITGASSGIGRSTAIALRETGYTVFGTSRKPVADFNGVTMLVCDVTSDDSVTQMVTSVLKQAGHIDLLVNNAGIGLLGAAEESSAAQAQALFDVNVFGVIRVTNAVLPSMRQHQSGRIINMSSVLGLIPSPYNALYSATKHAIEGYSESLDHEVRSMGIRVVLVEPAFTNTSFETNLIKPDQALTVYEAERLRMYALLQPNILAGDAPEVVAKAVVKAAAAHTPKRRYTAGRLAAQIRMMRRFLPEAMMDKGMRKSNGFSN
jgi:short-subunit dehydrogenase